MSKYFARSFLSGYSGICVRRSFEPILGIQIIYLLKEFLLILRKILIQDELVRSIHINDASFDFFDLIYLRC